VRRPSLDRRSAGIVGAAAAAAFAADVQYYLTLDPPQLPSRYLYDPLGSALFDAICLLPWYGITRAETALLAAHGREIFRRLAPLSTLVELGPGSGDKLRTLIDTGAGARGDLEVHLVDVSRAALDRAAHTLAASAVDLRMHEATYEGGLAAVARAPLPAGRTLVLFLGSNIGNFDPPAAAALMRSIRAALTPGDALLIGADLVKPEPQLLAAYDDPLGVTAAFNRNLLVRINRELGGDVDVAAFAHRAVWNAEQSRIEMHLVAVADTRIRVAAANLDFAVAAGDAIWTESSYKYQPTDVVHLLERAAFRPAAQWVDEANGFALTLVEAG